MESYTVIADIVKNAEIIRGQIAISSTEEEYNDMLVNRDREVLVLEPENEYTAYAVGMNHMGELIVRTAEGEEKAIFAGEVSVRGIYGYV